MIIKFPEKVVVKSLQYKSITLSCIIIYISIYHYLYIMFNPDTLNTGFHKSQGKDFETLIKKIKIKNNPMILDIDTHSKMQEKKKKERKKRFLSETVIASYGFTLWENEALKKGT